MTCAVRRRRRRGSIGLLRFVKYVLECPDVVTQRRGINRGCPAIDGNHTPYERAVRHFRQGFEVGGLLGCGRKLHGLPLSQREIA